MNHSNDENTLRPELQRAVALFYDGQSTPLLSAKGAGKDAQEIIDLARENNVPLCSNPDLLDLLANLDPGDQVPEELYVAIAQVIGFAYYLRWNQTPSDTDRLSIG